MKVKLSELSLSVLSVLMVSCSSVPLVGTIPGMDRVVGENAIIQDRRGDYLEAETIPRTRIPSGLDSYIIDDLYIIPDLTESVQATAYLQVPRPRPLQGRSDRDVVIQRMDSQSWVVVAASPSQVWPRIRDYWRGQRVELALENPTAGLMETSWFNEEGNSLTQERFRIEVEPGFQDASSEIKLTHVSLPQAIPAFERIDWPESSADMDKEYERLSELALYLAEVSDLYQASTVSFLAGNISSKGKATLVESAEGPSLIRLRDDYVRCWAAIGRALESAGVEVVSQDRDMGIFDVVYNTTPQDADEPGFFGKLNPFRRNRDASGAIYNMRIELDNTGEQIQVEVENLEETEPVEDETLQPEASLLRTIMSNLA